MSKLKLGSVLSQLKEVNGLLFVVSVISISVFFYLLNLHFLPYLDDWGYSFAYTGEKANNFFEIVRSEYDQYIQWGGRSVVHIIARTLLWFGDGWNNILNALAYVVLVLLIYYFSNRGKKANIPLFFIINILIWFTLPSFSQNLLWITGSANYLWGCLLIYSLLYFYISYYFKEENKKNSGVLIKILFLLGGIIAGWTNENMGIALIFFLFVFLLYMRYNKRPIPQWMIYGLIGVLVGYAIMMLSPGNAYRSKCEFMAIHKLEEVPLSFYFYRFITVIKFSWTHLLIPVLVYIVMLCVYIGIGKGEEKRKRDILFLSLLFFCTSAVATVVMSGSPSFPDRAWFGIIILLITSIAILYANIDFSVSILKYANIFIFFVVFSVYVISCIESYSELLRFEKVCLEREKAIDRQIEQGVEDVVIRDDLFQEKESKLVVLDLKDWLLLDDSFGGRYGFYKRISSVTIERKDDLKRAIR
ncbi:MAG: DUF6056 family protein [Dysgonomonas sp.]|nr:DUF6056 family protein [Dysgonomonas sp.]